MFSGSPQDEPNGLSRSNILGRPNQPGDLERRIGRSLSAEERERAARVMRRLESDGLLVAPRRDVVAPDEWLEITRTGRERLAALQLSLSSGHIQMNYDVVLSFAGEDRGYAEELAECLRAQGVKVFYDKYEQASLWGKDLYEHLHSVYSEQAVYCVIFVSEHYAKKIWATHERKAAQERALNERGAEYILPIRIDETRLPGVPGAVGYTGIEKSS